MLFGLWSYDHMSMVIWSMVFLVQSSEPKIDAAESTAQRERIILIGTKQLWGTRNGRILEQAEMATNVHNWAVIAGKQERKEVACKQTHVPRRVKKKKNYSYYMLSLNDYYKIENVLAIQRKYWRTRAWIR